MLSWSCCRDDHEFASFGLYRRRMLAETPSDPFHERLPKRVTFLLHLHIKCSRRACVSILQDKNRFRAHTFQASEEVLGKTTKVVKQLVLRKVTC